MIKFLKNVLNVAGVVSPQVAAATTIVNTFLPNDKKLTPKATGSQVIEAYNTLPASDQQAIAQRAELELAEIGASVDRLEAMVSVESRNSNTRPLIAFMMAVVVCLAVLAMMLLWGKAVWHSDAESLQSLADSWELMLVLLATPTALLRAYFGMKTKEKKARYAAATGQPIAGAVAQLVGMFRK